jgi:hypothetical protein
MVQDRRGLGPCRTGEQRLVEELREVLGDNLEKLRQRQERKRRWVKDKFLKRIFQNWVMWTMRLHTSFSAGRNCTAAAEQSSWGN